MALAGAFFFVLASSASASLAPSARKATLPAPVELGFAVPLQGPLESGFGQRWGRLHAGLDIGALSDDRVRAPLAGVVTTVGWSDLYWGYGNVVRLKHGDGLATLYAHLASIAVQKGDEVERGALLGRAGCTGSCTGQHLHFEVHVDGVPVDPLPYLEGQIVPRG